MTLEHLKNLTDELALASEIYYRNNGIGGTMSDVEFDLKFKELQAGEKEWGVVYPNSPTLRVGSDTLKEFAKIKHIVPMLTIENVYDDKGLNEWVEKMKKHHSLYHLSVKYDGVSCELTYKNNILVSASTRGDKMVGDDITANVRTIKSVPLTLTSNSLQDTFIVRGEILLPKSCLAKINEERVANGETPFSNTRNACSGSIKLLDSKEVAKRGLIFRAWDCFFPDFPDKFPTMQSKTNYLEKIGFKIEDMTQPFTVSSNRVIEYAQAYKNKLDSLNLDYDYDGVVIKLDDIDIQNKIGTKDTRAIEWGIARKWNEEYEVWTFLNGVEWQVGRTGVVTPVGLLEPVECAGVTISNVTLHNADFVKEFDMHIGNDLKITRSGGVIPYVLEVKHDLLMEMHNAHKKVEIPEFCPVCGEKLTMDGKLLKCTNPKCKAQIEGKILQFCSKDCCDIRTIGESVVHDIVEKNLVSEIGELLYLGAVLSNDAERAELKEKWLYRLGKGYGEKTVDNIFDAIVNARINTPLEKIVAGLSIPNVGKVMARTLCKRFKNVHEFAKCTKNELMEIEGIAETTADGIYNWINYEGGHNLLYLIDEYGWNYDIWEQVDNNTNTLPLEGLTVCFTGKSNKFSGDEIENFLESKGAKCTHSVSKTMSYLITGEKPGGSKVAKAESYNIPIISESDFFEKFNLI